MQYPGSGLSPQEQGDILQANALNSGIVPPMVVGLPPQAQEEIAQKQLQIEAMQKGLHVGAMPHELGMAHMARMSSGDLGSDLANLQ